MSNERPDPNCPHCHGTGLITQQAPSLDRVDEMTVVCRCTLAAPTVDPSEEDTLVMKAPQGVG